MWGGAKIDLTHIVFAAGKNVKMLPKLRGGGGLLAQIDFETYLKMIMMLASKESERQKTKFEK